jgi:hypothetical protein
MDTRYEVKITKFFSRILIHCYIFILEIHVDLSIGVKFRQYPRETHLFIFIVLQHRQKHVIVTKTVLTRNIYLYIYIYI